MAVPVSFTAKSLLSYPINLNILNSLLNITYFFAAKRPGVLSLGGISPCGGKFVKVNVKACYSLGLAAGDGEHPLGGSIPTFAQAKVEKPPLPKGAPLSSCRAVDDRPAALLRRHHNKILMSHDYCLSGPTPWNSVVWGFVLWPLLSPPEGVVPAPSGVRSAVADIWLVSFAAPRREGAPRRWCQGCNRDCYCYLSTFCALRIEPQRSISVNNFV